VPAALARSAAEGAALALAAGGAARLFLGGPLAREAWVGLGAAWLVGLASLALLRKAGPGRSFLKAYAAGLGLRVLVLGGLMACVWGEGFAVQAARLLSYAFGTLSLMLLEVRHLNRT